MKWIAAASILIFGGGGLAHTVAKKKVDRGVFVSAQELAASCQIMKDEVGENYLFLGRQGVSRLPGKPTTDMAAVGRCTGYLEGVADEFRESTSHYLPILEGRGELPILVDTFLKRVAEHPEEADLAASTVLHEADRDVLRMCGDCGFGLLVYRPRH
jgi:hypothetical protein